MKPLADLPTVSDDRARVLGRLNVSRETAQRLDDFVALLLKWQRRINLVAPSTLPTLWTRHILDSAQLAALAEGRPHWIDLGSGAGFPGLVIGILLAEKGVEVELIEGDRRKCAFLHEAIRITGAPVVVRGERIEQAMPRFAARAAEVVVTARALAPLADLLHLAGPLLTNGALGIFPKGQALESEMSEAIRRFDIEARTVASETDADGRILVVKKLRLCPDAPQG